MGATHRFFCGERKHRVFKSIVAPRLSRLDFFTRSTLLQMTEIELTTSHSESEYTGQLLGKQTQDACRRTRSVY